MPSIGSITKTIRINAEDKVYIEELMDENNLTWSGAVHKLVSERGVPQKKAEESEGVPKKEENIPQGLAEIKVMLPFYGLNLEEFYERLSAAMNSGTVMYEDGEFKGRSEVDLRRFKEACEDKGVDMQKMVDKMTQMVWQS